MSDVFISYARSTAKQAQQVAEALRGLGFSVWIDDDLPAHRTYSRVIEEQMTAAKAAVVIWSADAVQSEWVMSEANRAREDHKLVQVTTDTARLPMPFDTIQCADLAGWSGEVEAPGWRKVVASIADLVGGSAMAASPAVDTPLQLPSKPSIAVLPFANLSGDPEQEYFADGMVEEITSALSRYKSIFVIGSGSGLSFKGETTTPQEAARTLGVRYVLDGSVRKAGNRVRIAVKLIDASDGAQIWAERFEDTLEDVFALQDKVALSVAGVIEPTVQIAEIRRASKRPTDSMGSYDLYLRAVSLRQAIEATEVFEALDFLDRAIALDPDFGPALAVAAQCHNFVVGFGWSDDPEGHRRRGIDLARRAVRVAGDDAQVLAQSANAMAGLEGNLDAATPLIDRAIALNPGSSQVWFTSGVLKIRLGEPDVAVQHFETAMRLDPLTSRLGSQRMFTGLARFQQRRFPEALALLKEAAQQVRSPTIPAYLVAIYGHLGRTSDGQDALLRYREASSAPIESRALGRSQHRRLFREGIALAEGNGPVDNPSRG